MRQQEWGWSEDGDVPSGDGSQMAGDEIGMVIKCMVNGDGKNFLGWRLGVGMGLIFNTMLLYCVGSRLCRRSAKCNVIGWKP